MPTVNSSNPVVSNALAANAASASGDVLAYVRRAPCAATATKRGPDILLVSTPVPEDEAERLYRKVERYLAKRVNVGLCRFEVDYRKRALGGRDAAFLSVTIPQSAVLNSSAAKNADVSVLVSFDTITAKGVEKIQAKMSTGGFDAWAKKIGVEASLQRVWFGLMKGEDATLYAKPMAISVRAI